MTIYAYLAKNDGQEYYLGGFEFDINLPTLEILASISNNEDKLEEYDKIKLQYKSFRGDKERIIPIFIYKEKNYPSDLIQYHLEELVK